MWHANGNTSRPLFRRQRLLEHPGMRELLVRFTENSKPAGVLAAQARVTSGRGRP